MRKWKNAGIVILAAVFAFALVSCDLDLLGEDLVTDEDTEATDEEQDGEQEEEQDPDGVTITDDIPSAAAAVYLRGSALLPEAADGTGKELLNTGQLSFPGDTFVNSSDELQDTLPGGSVALSNGDVYTTAAVLLELSDGFRNNLGPKYQSPGETTFPGDSFVADGIIAITGNRLVSLWESETYNYDQDTVFLLNNSSVMIPGDTFVPADLTSEEIKKVSTSGVYIPGDTFFPGDSFVPADTFFPGDSFVERFLDDDRLIPGDTFLEAGATSFPGDTLLDGAAFLIVGEHGIVQDELIPELSQAHVDLLNAGGGVFMKAGHLIGPNR